MRASAQVIRYPRRDFGGGVPERAYLLGFRLGDLHVALAERSVVVKCSSTRPEQGSLFTAIRSYDRNVLTQLGEGLNAREIRCPPARLRVRAGYTNGYGVRSDGDPWGLGISRKDSLADLVERIDPYVRHARRRKDMERAWAVVQARPERTVRPAAGPPGRGGVQLHGRRQMWIKRE